MMNRLEILKQDLNCLISHKNVFHKVVYQVLIQRYQKELKELNYHYGQEIKHTNEQE